MKKFLFDLIFPITILFFANQSLGSEVIPKIDFSILRNFKTNDPNSANIKKLTDDHLVGKPTPKTGKLRAKDQLARRGGGTGEGREGSGTRGGGSGVALTTSQGEIIKVLALDVYRSLNIRKFPTFFIPNPQFVKTKDNYSEEEWSEYLIDQILEKLKPLLPTLYESLSKAREEFKPSTWTVTDQRLPLIDNFIGDEIDQNNFRQVQIAYRVHHRFVIDRYYYNKMDGFNRAAIKLHEFIYAISDLHESIIIQRMVSLILSPQLDDDLESITNYRNHKISEEDVGKAKLLQFILYVGLRHLSSPIKKQLPKNIIEGVFEPRRLMHYCGPINDIEINRENKQTRVLFDFDTENEHVDTLNFLPISDRFLSRYQANKIGEVVLEDNEEIKTFFMALLYTKSSLQHEFPLYLYPGRSFPPSVICVNRWTGNVLSIDTIAVYDPEKNKRELNYAKSEVEYIESVSSSRQLWQELNNAEHFNSELSARLNFALSLAEIEKKKLNVLRSGASPMTLLLERLSSQLEPGKNLELLGRVRVKIERP